MPFVPAVAADADANAPVALADAALFTPHKLELSAPGKQLLCEVGKAAEKRQLVVSAADADETADAALTQKYPNAWALRAARAAAAADGLQSKCGATAQLIVKTPGGSAPGNSAFQGSKLPHVHLEFELRAPTR